MMNEEQGLAEISKYAGARFDLVQAGGGNTSVKKAEGTMLIKASGYTLSDIEPGKGFAEVKTSKIVDILSNKDVLSISDKRERSALASSLVKEAALSGPRPSIETFLHAMLDTYTLHVHPIVAMAIVAEKGAKDTVLELFNDSCFVGYETPGIDLALLMKKEVDAYKEEKGAFPKLVFLKNHGFIATGPDADTVIEATESAMEKIEKYLGLDFSAYKNTTVIMRAMKSVAETLNIAYYPENEKLQKSVSDNEGFLATPALVPDTLVYCGMKAVRMKTDKDTEPLKEYYERYGKMPAVIVYGDKLYITAANIKKAKEIEEVLYAHLLTQKSARKDIAALSEEELLFLGNWEAEKYRQNI